MGYQIRDICWIFRVSMLRIVREQRLGPWQDATDLQHVTEALHHRSDDRLCRRKKTTFLRGFLQPTCVIQKQRSVLITKPWLHSENAMCLHTRSVLTFLLLCMLEEGRGNAVGIATALWTGQSGDRNPLGGGGWRRNGYWVSFPWVKRPRRGVNHPPQLAPRLKKE